MRLWAFTNSFVNCGGSFTNPFYEPFCGIGCVVSDIFYDIGAVVEIPEGYVELGG